ncbi:4-hydroxyproline epimerase [compost metagenome]
MQAGDVLVHESIIGSQFTGTIEAECEVAGIPAIIPGVAGWAITTGYNRILLDDADPYVHGFVVA